MSNRKPSAQGRAIAAIKAIEPLGQVVIEPTRNARPDVPARPRRAEALALQIQEGNLIEGVDGAQPRIELQAVDDPDLVIEPDVLRP